MRKRILGLLLSLALVSVLVAGCGQSGSTSSSNSNDYVIGAPEPMTGSTADMGTDMFNAMKMAADQLNKQGGILGHQVKLVEEDSACDPQTSVNAANKLVSLNVDAIVGQYCSGAALPAEPIYHTAGLPFILPDANASSLTQQGFDDVFLINVGGETQAQTAADFMVKTLGAKSVALIDDQSAFAVNLSQLTNKDVVADGGTVADSESVAATQVDLSSLISKLKSVNPGAVYFTGYYSQGGLLIKQARQMGLKSKIVVGDGSWDPKLITIAGQSNAEGVYVTCTPSADLLPNAKAWIAQYQTLYNTAPGPYAADAYDAVMLLNHVITKINSTDKAKVIQALHQTSDYQGLTGTLQFTSNGTREHGTEVVLVVKDGKFVLNQ
ncbi:MAG TPA: branched-chain amino acid ABC transporter substrate-binding protein [Spirochaetia bacterium]|nr:branched-chain amino acid ABC transporter substrate-binding protein [Spirochaetia bacterium]